MKQTLSTSAHLRLLSKQIAELVYGLETMAAAQMDAAARLKSIDALLRLKKAMLETRLLEEELRERLRQRAGRSKTVSRRAGISPEALEEIGQVLGLRPAKKRGEQAPQTNPAKPDPGIDKVGD